MRGKGEVSVRGLGGDLEELSAFSFICGELCTSTWLCPEHGEDGARAGLWGSGQRDYENPRSRKGGHPWLVGEVERTTS